tara:strand:- start:208 stop:345 length:138 start_codon:yes stop_codon:yes gene_type:complete
MIKALLFLLEKIPHTNENIKTAKGFYKYPETWHEFKNFIKLRLNE